FPLGFRFLGLGLLALLLLLLGFLVFDHVHAHFAEHGQNVFDLLGIDLFRRQHRVDLVDRDVAALLGVADQFLDGRVREVEQRERSIRRVRRLSFRCFHLFGLFFLEIGLGLGRYQKSLLTSPTLG